MPGHAGILECDIARVPKCQMLRSNFCTDAYFGPVCRGLVVHLGLHLHKLLNKYDHAGTATYTG